MVFTSSVQSCVLINRLIAILILFWQRNVAGSSQAMEMLGFKQCMDSLLVWGIVFDTFITDRHSSIAKYMRENLAHIKHYFDLWHLKLCHPTVQK
jgi:hypothetical protein